tara:strand:+ start:315 stop:881 length:567 start_codon:yes stop_codon:yes gene_type:complete
MKVKFYIFSLFIFIYACKHSYYDIEKRELNSGIRYDSIFFDLHFGMTSKEFYDRCWELNKQEVVKEGPSNSSVKYLIKEGVRYDTEMLFYPKFHENKVYMMLSTFSYVGWAPWNRDRFSNILLDDVKQLLESWYGGSFLAVKGENDKKLYVMVQGNRRITISIIDDRDVRVRFTDLSISKTINQNIGS